MGTIDQSRPDPSTATGFGRRRQPGRRRPATAEPSVDTNDNLLDQVKAELSRREQFSQSQNLGPSALDSLLTQSSQPTSSRNPGLRRGPVSRGGVGLPTSSNEDRRPQVRLLVVGEDYRFWITQDLHFSLSQRMKYKMSLSLH